MSYGIANEYLAYAIAQMAKEQTRKFMYSEGMKVINDNIGSIIYGDSEGENYNNLKLVSNVLSSLESHNFTLDLLKEDLNNPNRLTSVIVVFEENVKQVIDLLRNEGKLSSVIISVYIKDDTMKDSENPFGMPTSIFVDYVFNKYKFNHYNEIFLSEGSNVEEKQDAQIKMNEASIENQNLRNLYNIPSDLHDVSDLSIYLPNPLMMTEPDFILYLLNKKIAYLYHVGEIDMPDLGKLEENNNRLRAKYFVKDDVYSYSDLKIFSPNPLGMLKEDLFEYYQIKEITRDMEDTIEATVLEKPLKDKYYIQDYEDMGYEELADLISSNKLEDNEQLLFKIEVSLNYLSGRLRGVDSKMFLQGDL